MPSFEPSPDLDPVVARAITDAIDSLRTEILGEHAPTADVEAPAPGGKDRLEELELAARALDSTSSQTELLAKLLQEAGRFTERALFLVRDDNALTGWAAYGFGDDADAVTGLALAGGPWDALISNGAAVDLDGDACRDVSAALGARHAKAGVLVPFTLRSHVAGALYADGDSPDRPALRLLTRVASLALETLPARMPSADEPVVAVDVEMEEAVDEVAGRIQEVEAETAETQEADFVAIHQEVRPETLDTAVEGLPKVDVPDLEEGTDDFEQVVNAEIGNLDEAPSAVDSASSTPEISSISTEVPDPASLDVSSARVIEPAEIAPPPDLEGPGWAFGVHEASPEDSRHEEAQRLARLLVTEIKLYNEEKVREARESQNLYESLREDIERSQRIYDERIDEEVRAATDYFQDELVRILAGGDPAALGA